MGKTKLSIMDRTATYEGACEVLGIKPLTIEDFNHLPESQQKAAFSRHVVETAIEAINEGHEFDWNNYSEYKYYPWWWLKDQEGDAAGSGFALLGVVCTGTLTDVGARLCTRTDAHARHIAEKYFDHYRNFIK